jgi:alpha-beta hydrolase superfamily lysophospholipase
VNNKLQTDQITHDPAVLAAAAADPLNHLQTTARFVAEIPKAQAAVLAGARQLRSPLLLLYAGCDSLVDPRAAETFFARAGSADKAKCCYADYYHEIFNEVGPDFRR